MRGPIWPPVFMYILELTFMKKYCICAEQTESLFKKERHNADRGHKVYFTNEELLHKRDDNVQSKFGHNYNNGAVTVKNNEFIDRQDISSFGANLQDLLEESYRRLITDLPTLIDTSRDEISEDIAKTNMFGYTIVGGFFWGALFDTLAYMIKQDLYWLEVITVEKFFWIVVYLWGYAVGFSGPFMFPSTFGSGDPNLRCSSQQFFNILARSELSLDIRSVVSRSNGELLVVTEQLRREFNLNLDCILARQGKYKSAAIVGASLDELIEIIFMYKDLSGDDGQVTNSIDTLDSALVILWDQFPVLVLEAEELLRESLLVRNAIYVLVGLANVVGQVGGNMKIITDIIELLRDKKRNKEKKKSKDKQNKRLKLLQQKYDANINKLIAEHQLMKSVYARKLYKEIMTTHLSANTTNLLNDDFETQRTNREHSVDKESALEYKSIWEATKKFFKTGHIEDALILGHFVEILGVNGWGYSYAMIFFLFLEGLVPECGVSDLTDVVDSYQDFADPATLVQVTGGSGSLFARYRVSQWRRQMRISLHCLVTREEGALLSDTIEMWARLATHRINLSSL